MYKIFILMFFCVVNGSLSSCSLVDIAPNQQSDVSEKLSNFLDKIDDLANEALLKFNVPGAAIGIVVDDQIIFTRGYGLRQINQNLPVTTHTLFRIASCTKSFTATILGQLVDEGKIAFDDPVKKYIPEFNLLNHETAMNLTIRDLLAHRTGFARHDPIWFFSKIPRTSVIGLFNHLQEASSLREEFKYSNFMYSIAGIVIERVTGQSWEESVSDRLFKPLNMMNSTPSLEEMQMSLDFSTPYAEVNGKIKNFLFRDTFAVNPGSGINSNIEDMAKWIQFQISHENFLNKNILQYQTLQELRAIQMPISYPQSIKDEKYPLGYGLGWFIGKYRDHDYIDHGGDIDGYSSDVFLLPKEKIGIVILTNSSSDGRHAISVIRNQILDAFLGLEKIDWMAKNLESRNRNKQALQKTLQAFDDNVQTINEDVLLEDYVGIYEHPAYGTVSISIQDHQLLFSYCEASALLKYMSEDVFSGQFPDLLAYGINPIMDITFIRNGSGEIDKIQVPFEGFRGEKPILFSRHSENQSINDQLE